MSKTIICSHGFGVKADARGMFTEIAEAFPEYTFKMFDYNEVLSNGNIVVAPLHQQATTLQDVIDETIADEIILLCHSQGCIIAGLVELSKVSKVILLAPPVVASMQHVINKLANKPGGELNIDGVSKLPRSDGSTTLLPKEYLTSLDSVNPLELYVSIARVKPTVIVRATNDEVLGMTNVDKVASAQSIDIAANHDFTGPSRNKLIETLEGVL